MEKGKVMKVKHKKTFFAGIVGTLIVLLCCATPILVILLGAVGLGEGGATINEFSTDGTFSANSNSVVPTQAAIITYINSQIGGGSSSLNVNAVTAGKINITGNTISTTDNSQITVTTGMNFNGGILGSPVAMAYFLTSKT